MKNNIENHLFGADFIHNVNVLSREFPRLKLLYDFISSEMVNNLPNTDSIKILGTVAEDISKGLSFSGNRKIDIPNLNGKHVNVIKIYDEKNLLVSVKEVNIVSNELLREELSLMLSEKYGNELVTLASFNPKFGEVTRVQENEGYNANLSKINLTIDSEIVPYFWDKTTSSISYIIYRLNYFGEIIEESKILDDRMKEIEAFVNSIDEEELYEEIIRVTNLLNSIAKENEDKLKGIVAESEEIFDGKVLDANKEIDSKILESNTLIDRSEIVLENSLNTIDSSNKNLVESKDILEESKRILGSSATGIIGYAKVANLPSEDIIEGSVAFVFSETNADLNGYYVYLDNAWEKSSYSVETSEFLSQVKKEGFLRLNSDSDFPNKSIARMGVELSIPKFLSEVVLDAKVVNAEPNRLYKIEYFKNGSTQTSGQNDGWIIRSYNKETFKDTETYFPSTNPDIKEFDYFSFSDTPDIPRDGKVHTVIIGSKRKENPTLVCITLDTSKLKTYGQHYNFQEKHLAGYNYVIDPCNYFVSFLPQEKAGYLENNSNATFPNRLFEVNYRTNTVGQNSKYNECVLDIKVIGAEKGFVYSLNYIANGVKIGANEYPDGFIILKRSSNVDFDYTYRSFSYEDIPENSIDRDVGGIQTILLNSPRGYKERFQVTINVDLLPKYGTKIDTQYPYVGSSYIIDPSNYFYANEEDRKKLDNIKESIDVLNRYSLYEFSLQMERKGVSSEVNSFLVDTLKNVKVYGAKKDHYYKLAYFINGSTALVGAKPYGWIIEEFTKEQWDTMTNLPRAVTYTDEAPAFPLDGEIHTIMVQNPRRKENFFMISLDSSKLPNFGRFIKMNQEKDDGYSWLIDPINYVYENDSPAESSNKSTVININTSKSGEINFNWRSGEDLIRVRFRPNGYNSLPNISNIDYKKISESSWTNVTSASTDYLPPLVLKANNNGDGHRSVYTGGNHGSNGSAGGEKTAINVGYSLLVSGSQVPIDGSSYQSEEFSIVVDNLLCAYNTCGDNSDPDKFPKRYVLNQTFIIHVKNGCMGVTSRNRALEDVTIFTDNAVQTVTRGIDNSLYYMEGNLFEKIPFDATTTSGTKSVYPKCWGVVFEGNSISALTYMDRSFKDGNGRYVNSSRPYIRGGGATNTKFYHAAISGEFEFNAGETYEWRGGYSWTSNTNSSGSFDRIFNILKGSVKETVAIKNGNDYIVG